MRDVRFVFAAWILSATNVSQGAERIKFNRDIRPILADKCFACHGPDKNKRTVELQLDVRQSAIDQKAIVPGNLADSKMLTRILSEDPDVQMPPPSFKLERLTSLEVDTIRQWIIEGAEYEAHWSFIPLKPKSVSGTGFVNGIDGIVADSLARRGMKQQPAANRLTLFRRLCFDLTGLPPTGEDVEAFLADKSPDSYEVLVDRLLQSERYGERMAMDWLDLARYADSYGFQVDRERDVWAWRDWVINSFNGNLPFDQFITWQLAGDLLPDATDEQILATAFNRLHQQETEGGSVEEEYRVEYVCDRVQTFATTFLGLTFECARCHDHKYDPITQQEFYQIFAMFQNIDEAGMYSYRTSSTPTPTLLLADNVSKTRLRKLAQEVEQVEQTGHALRDLRRAEFRNWLETRPDELTFPGEVARYSLDHVDKGELATTLALDKPAILHGDNQLIPGKFGQAVQLTGDDPVKIPLGNYPIFQPFSVSLWLKTPDVKERAVIFHRSGAWTDSGSRGYELLIVDGKLRWSLIHFWPGNAISIEARDKLPVNEWVHVAVGYDGSSRADGLWMSVNGQKANFQIFKDQLTKNITGGGDDNISLGERKRDRGFKDGLIDEFRVFSRNLTGLESQATYDLQSALQILRKPVTELSDLEQESLWELYLATVDSEWSQHLSSLLKVRDEQSQFLDKIPELMVMRELALPKKAYVLFRGDYAQRRDEVSAGTPVSVFPFPAGAPLNRLGLARWLTDRQHPLTARVTVNRFWQSLFGVGLVKTAEDFGSQGSPPLYPELLDWLALRFLDSGWDTKSLIKTIVMSQTYRQRSLGDHDLMTDDPENMLLARGPRFRLQAEMIRDNVLASSGLLQQQLGGPSVNPYEMTESFKPAKITEGTGVYRRSLYTHWRRSGPPPALLAFDAPRRAVCTARRERTDSPLQPLILLNGTQYVEAARVLGELLYQSSQGSLPVMIRQGCLRCLSRLPDQRETEIFTHLYQEQLAHFEKHPMQAEDLLKIGLAARSGNIPAPEAAAATILAQAFLNHDEAVVKR